MGHGHKHPRRRRSSSDDGDSHGFATARYVTLGVGLIALIVVAAAWWKTSGSPDAVLKHSGTEPKREADKPMSSDPPDAGTEPHNAGKPMSLQKMSEVMNNPLLFPKTKLKRRRSPWKERVTVDPGLSPPAQLIWKKLMQHIGKSSKDIETIRFHPTTALCKGIKQYIFSSSRRKQIHAVDMVLNRSLIQQFKEKQKEYKRENIPFQPIFAFHATPDTENLDPATSDKGSFGAGVYFSKENPALGYSEKCSKDPSLRRAQCAAKHGADCWKGSGRVLMCLVLPGKRTIVEYKNDLSTVGCKLRPGFQSHEGYFDILGGLVDNLVIFDKAQIIPLFIVNTQKPVKTFMKVGFECHK